MLHEFIFTHAPFAECHAATLVETPRGLVAAWFGGTREGADDVTIWAARRDADGWRAPVQVATGTTPDGKPCPCWNPVLYHAMPEGELLLFYKVGPSPRAWWGMLLRSTDDGATWSAPERLPDGILGPVKNKPVRLADGTLLCPASTESEAAGRPLWECFIERTPDLGRTWERSGPLNDWREIAAVQPALLLWPDGRLRALCRTMQGFMAACDSADGGGAWGAMALTALPNPNSGIDGVVLRDGRAVLCYNPTVTPPGEWGGPRTPLMLAVSDDGMVWRDAVTLEDGPGEYSYPAVIQAADGEVHVAYTWRRAAIRHAVVDAAPVAH
jgi:predicted neuraminidase